MTNKDIILIFDHVLAAQQADHIQKYQNAIIISSDGNVQQRLSELGITSRVISEYLNDYSSELRSILSWIQRWPDTPVLDGKSFKEILVYHGMSIFWFLQTRLYIHRMKELLLLIEHIKAMIAFEKPTSIRVIGNSDAEYIASWLQHKHSSSNSNIQSHSDINYRSYSGHLTFKLLMLKLLRGTFNRSIHRGRQDARKKILVITETSNWRQDFDFESGKYVERDVFFHGIINQLLQAQYDVTVVDFENRRKRLFKAYSDNILRQRGFGVPVKPWEQYVNFDIIKRSKSAHAHAIKVLSRLQNSKEFVDSLIYSGIPLHDILKSDFEGLFNSLKTYVSIALIEAAERIVEAERPAAIIMHDEYGALQLAILRAAREKGIPTVSLQHGLITEENIAYVHEISHIRGEKPELLFPIPDRMCVWGQGAYDHLIKVGNFSPSVPVITGDPKVDFVHKALDTFDRQRIITKLDLPANKKIIMFATENLPYAERDIVAKTVFEGAKEMPECFLAVKVHPLEEDEGLYQQLAKTYGLSSFSVTKYTNLYELLYLADVIIIVFSTVGAEALRMGKPVISLNLNLLHENVPFIKNNIATVVREAGNLVPAIRKCLDGQDPNTIRRAREFAERELGRIDGQATKRVVQLLIELTRTP